METREIPTNPYSAGILGAARHKRETARDASRVTPDPNPGRVPQREVAAPAKGTSQWQLSLFKLPL